MPTINVLAVLGDARSISQQFSTRRSAAATVVAWAADEFYTRAPIVAVYVYQEGRPLEHLTVEALRAELHPDAALVVEALAADQAAIRKAEGLGAAPAAVDLERRPPTREVFNREGRAVRVTVPPSDSYRCAGCGCEPGDGRTPGCTDPEGCGYFEEV